MKHVVILPLVFAKLLNVLMGSVLYLQIKLVKIVYVAYVLTATIYLKIVVVTANTLGTTAVTLLSKPRLQLRYYYQYRVNMIFLQSHLVIVKLPLHFIGMKMATSTLQS